MGFAPRLCLAKGGRVMDDARQDQSGAPRLSVVIPTYNERASIAPLIARLREVLADIAWEVIVVDDDSPDGTHEEVTRLAQDEPRVRCLRRVGRRGLSSAVIEGMLVANADAIAVMDADFQHDESKLPEMHARLIAEDADVVVGTRYSAGGGTGDWAEDRVRMSALANRRPDLTHGGSGQDGCKIACTSVYIVDIVYIVHIVYIEYIYIYT